MRQESKWNNSTRECHSREWNQQETTFKTNIYLFSSSFYSVISFGYQPSMKQTNKNFIRPKPDFQKIHRFSSGWPASHGLWSQLISLSRSLFKRTSSHELLYYLKSVFLITKYSPCPALMPRKRENTAQLPPRVTANKSCMCTRMSLLPPLGAVCSTALCMWCRVSSGLGLSSLRNQLPLCKEAQASLRNNERSHGGEQTQVSQPPAPADCSHKWDQRKTHPGRPPWQ